MSEDVDMLWGVATSSYQVEGFLNGEGEPWNNWRRWDADGSVEQCGEALRFWKEPELLLDRAAAIGCNAFRLSLEWARIQPTAGRLDAQALNRYVEILLMCRQRGLEPVLTLQHFTHPAWCGEDLWLDPASPALFGAYVAAAVGQLNERLIAAADQPIRWWVTINEPSILVLGTYFLGVYPGGGRSIEHSTRAYDHLLAAHVVAYDAIHDSYEDRALPSPKVSTNTSATTIAAADALQVDALLARERGVPRREFSEYLRRLHPVARRRLESALPDGLGARLFDAIGDRWARREVLRGLDAFVEELYRSRRARKLDYFALDYYDPVLIHMLMPGTRKARGLRKVRILAEPWEQKISSRGFAACLRQLHLQAPGRPIVVAENGLFTPPDVPRPDGFSRDRFLRQAIATIERARAAGIRVQGYLHWTIADNYEWGSYAPRAGLHGVDRSDGLRLLAHDIQGCDAAGVYRRALEQLQQPAPPGEAGVGSTGKAG
jgi:beta-glucosidase